MATGEITDTSRRIYTADTLSVDDYPHLMTTHSTATLLETDLDLSPDYSMQSPDSELVNRVTLHNDLLPMEHMPLKGVIYSQPIAFALKNLYMTDADKVKNNWLQSRAPAGRREMIRPSDTIPGFARERNGELYEYAFLFAGVDGMGNCIYVFKTEEDPHYPQPVTRQDYLVLSAYGTEGSITEPVVDKVTYDETSGTYKLELYNPRFDPKLDKTPPYAEVSESVTAAEYREIERARSKPSAYIDSTPEGFQKIKMSWRESGDNTISDAAIERFTNNGFTHNREIIQLPTGQSVRELNELNPERQILLELMTDQIIAPENAKIRDELAKFSHNDMGDPVQAIREQSAPPPGDGFDNVVAIGSVSKEGLVLSVRTCNQKSDSNVPEHYTVAVVDTNTGESFKSTADWAWQEKSGRVYLEIQNFNGQGWAYVSWMVGKTGAGYDVEFKRNYSDSGEELLVIDDLMRMIKRRSGGLDLNQIVDFDKKYEQIDHIKKLARRILDEPRAYQLVDEMVMTYIGLGLDDDSELPKVERERNRGHGEVVDFKHKVDAFTWNEGIYSIRSTRDDGHGNPDDYLITICDTQIGVIEEFPAEWTWGDDKRFRLGFKNPYTQEIVTISCDMLDGEMVSDSWVHEPWGESLFPFDDLLQMIYKESGGHDGLEQRRKTVAKGLGGVSLAEAVSGNQQ